MSGAWREAWIDALDALEAEVTQVERLLEDDHRMRDTQPTTVWSPPRELGLLPSELRERADAILRRQVSAARALSAAITSNRQQAAFASRVEAGRHATPPRPNYVDRAM
jgi:hypothetical protein